MKKITILLIILILTSLLVYNLYTRNIKVAKIDKISLKDEFKLYNSNIIKNVNYTSKDKNGNEYTIKAKVGEIDPKYKDIIFLEDLNGLISLSDNRKIKIKSDFGKYMINNNDTIFNKNVRIDSSDFNVKGEYLEFSIENNKLIISKQVTLKKNNNTTYADVVEIDLKTKNTKIFMLDDKQNILSTNTN